MSLIAPRIGWRCGSSRHSIVPSRAASNSSLGAFTVVELLVVVSIISLLVALLLPSLSKAREQARRLQCSTNLKAIATASLTYAGADPQEQAVPVHPLTGLVPGDSGAYDWGGKAGAGEPVSGEDTLSALWSTQLGRGPGTRPLNAVVYAKSPIDHQDSPGANQETWRQDQRLDLGLFRCPSDRGYRGHHYTAWTQSHLSSYDHYGTSYAANNWGGALADIGQNVHHYVGLSPFFRSLSLIPAPTNTLYYVENAGRFAWHVARGAPGDSTNCFDWTKSLGACGNCSPVRGWHGGTGKFTAAFADGHAGMIVMTGFRIPPPQLSHYPWINNLPNQQSTLGDPTFWSCVIIRGDAWQLDALPGPGVLTTIPYEYHTPFHATIE